LVPSHRVWNKDSQVGLGPVEDWAEHRHLQLDQRFVPARATFAQPERVVHISAGAKDRELVNSPFSAPRLSKLSQVGEEPDTIKR
jgi:hypothetical protein